MPSISRIGIILLCFTLSWCKTTDRDPSNKDRSIGNSLTPSASIEAATNNESLPAEQQKIFLVSLRADEPYHVDDNGIVSVPSKTGEPVGAALTAEPDWRVLGPLIAITSLPSLTVLAIYVKTDLRTNFLLGKIIPAAQYAETLHIWLEPSWINEADLLKHSGMQVEERTAASQRYVQILPEGGLKNGNLVVFFPGNFSAYEGFSSDDYMRMANLAEPENIDQRAGVMAVNYDPNIRSAADAVNGAKARLRDALALVGNDTSRLVVWGHSMGGAISTTALAELAIEDPKWRNARLINDRSFSTMAKVAANITALPESFLRWFFRTDWGLDIPKSMETLKPENVIVLTAEEDEVIKGKESPLGEKLAKVPALKDRVYRVSGGHNFSMHERVKSGLNIEDLLKTFLRRR